MSTHFTLHRSAAVTGCRECVRVCVCVCVCVRERGRRREEGGDESLPLFARRVDLCSWLVGLALDSSLTLHTNPESRNHR